MSWQLPIQQRHFEDTQAGLLTLALLVTSAGAANDSATTRVLLSGVMTIPFGKAISPATSRTSPSAS